MTIGGAALSSAATGAVNVRTLARELLRTGWRAHEPGWVFKVELLKLCSVGKVHSPLLRPRILQQLCLVKFLNGQQVALELGFGTLKQVCCATGGRTWPKGPISPSALWQNFLFTQRRLCQ